MKVRKYIWCPKKQGNIPLQACLKCRQFPCSALTLKDLEGMAAEGLVREAVERITKKKVSNMFFLVSEDEKTITPYNGPLNKMTAQQSDAAATALEIVHCIEQKVVWVPEGKEIKANAPASTGKVVCVIESKNGGLLIDEIDLASPNTSAAKIYPVKKKFVRQYVATKVALDNRSGRPRQAKKKT